MLDRLESKYAKTQGVAPSLLGGASLGGVPQELSNSPLEAIKSAFKPQISTNDPEVVNDAYDDDADWFDQAAAAENQGMTPQLDYPQGVQEPNSYTPEQLAGSLSSIDDDIRQRESSWNRLVNDGEREWAKQQNSDLRTQSAAKILAAEKRAAAAVHSAYITRAASSFQGVLMQNQVRQVVMDAKWEEARARAKEAAAEKQAAMLKVVNAATKAKAEDAEDKYDTLKKKARNRYTIFPTWPADDFVFQKL